MKIDHQVTINKLASMHRTRGSHIAVPIKHYHALYTGTGEHPEDFTIPDGTTIVMLGSIKTQISGGGGYEVHEIVVHDGRISVIIYSSATSKMVLNATHLATIAPAVV